MNLVAILRLLGLLLLLRLLFRFVGAVVRGYREADDREAASSRSRELVRDRVCNTFVPRARSLRVVIGGHEEHFCSSVCAQRALSEAAGNA